MDLELTLEQKFFLEKVKIDMEKMSSEQLKSVILEMMEYMYRKDQMWCKLLMSK
jgi:hypothetical protein